MDNETNIITETTDGQSPPNPKKKNLALRIVLIIVCVIVAAVVVFGAVFLPKYLKHRNFKNGMVGEYICIDANATLIAQGSGITDDWLVENFVDKTTLTIDENGKVILSDIEENLKLKNSSFNMGQILNNRYIVYGTDGKNTKSVGIDQLYYYKKGLQWSADKFCDKDRLKVYMWTDSVDADFAFSMTFEKTSSSSSSSKTSSKSSSSSSSSESKQLLTQSEAADVAEEYLKKRLKDGDVFIAKGSSHSAVTFDTISYGDVSVSYNDGVYGFEIKATCWGYDSHGDVVDKYEFDTRVLVDDERGTATGFGFTLKAT